MKTKRIRRLSIALVVSILVTFLFSVNVFAADKVVTKSMTLGSAVAVTSEVYSGGNTTYTFYKVSVPVGKYLSITSVPVAGKYSNLDIYAAAKVGSSYRVTGASDSTKKTWTTKVALEAGDYYISFYNVAKAKVTLPAAVNKANYCRSKAISLASGKAVTIVQTPDIDYNRWYKISLTKAKVLKLTSNKSVYVTVFNAKGAKCPLGSYNSSTKSCTTNNKLTKGTYYICVHANNFYSSTGSAYDKKGEYVVMKWS